MDKAQALHNFWSSFGLPAYDQLTVPDDAQMPYITYEVATDSFDNNVFLTASIWYNNFSWKDVTEKSEQVAKAIYDLYPSGIKIDGGRLLIYKGSPFAIRMNDDSDKMVRRIVLNIVAEFLTAY
jgi:GH35 family endo-1,4-beta-xylanase